MIGSLNLPPSPYGECDEAVDLFAAGRPSPVSVVRKTLQVHYQHRRKTPQAQLLVRTPVLLARGRGGQHHQTVSPKYGEARDFSH